MIGDLLGDDDVSRDPNPPCVEESPALVDHVGLDERAAGRMTSSEQEGEHHGPADQDRVAAPEERIDDAELVAHLRAAEYCHEGVLAGVEQA